MIKRVAIIISLLFILAGGAFALDVWQYPAMAEKHSIFAGVFAFAYILPYNYDYKHPEFFIDYILPFGLPFSFGVSANTISQDRTSFGIRPGYHININNDNADVYILYTVDYISQDAKPPYYGKYVFLEYGGRIGFRWRFGKFFCLSIESGYKFQSFRFGISIKIF